MSDYDETMDGVAYGTLDGARRRRPRMIGGIPKNKLRRAVMGRQDRQVVLDQGGIPFYSSIALTASAGTGQIVPSGRLYANPLGQTDPALGRLTIAHTNVKVAGQIDGQSNFRVKRQGFVLRRIANATVPLTAAALADLELKILQFCGAQIDLSTVQALELGSIGNWPLPTAGNAIVLPNGAAASDYAQILSSAVGWNAVAPMKLTLRRNDPISIQVDTSASQIPVAAGNAGAQWVLTHMFYGERVQAPR